MGGELVAMTNQILGKINFIYNKMADERSKEAFADRLEYLLNNDEMIFLNRIEKENLEVKCPELDKYERENRNQKGYIIFGAGFEGKKTLKIVEKSKRRVIAWCDNNRSLWGTDIEGKTVLSPGELINEYKDVSVIITARNYFLQIYQQLVMMGFPRNNLIIPESGFLIGFVGCQYFDLFEAKEREVFVDAGCWDGSSTKEFVNWCRGEYKKVYAFEPDAACWSACEKMFQNENIQNVSFIKKGTWKEEAILYFDGTGRGSSNVSDKKVSSLQVPVTSHSRKRFSNYIYKNGCGRERVANLNGSKRNNKKR